jgi:phosphomannomutase
MLASAVSSKMLKAVAEKEGFLFEETLTGFKWIGSRNLELQVRSDEERRQRA